MRKKSATIILTAIMLLSAILFPACGSDVSDMTPEYETGLMFDEKIGTSYYNYCNSTIVKGDDAYLWYCRNRGSAVQGDRIAFRQGKKKNGVWHWSEPVYALDPAEETAWDCAGQCDPNVIKGEFNYENKKYEYLMAYLGGDGAGNYGCTFGFAVAESIYGPWKRVHTISPLISFTDLYPNAGNLDPEQSYLWGAGQPSMISADKKGRILLFYTYHTDVDLGTDTSWTVVAERWDFSDLDNPVQEFSVKMRARGLKRRTGAEDTFTNADFMYDPERQVLYVATDVHPFGLAYKDGDAYPDNMPNIGRIAYADLTLENESVVGDTLNLTDGDMLWTDIIQISKENTGCSRNSNLGFFRDEYGYMAYPDKLEWGFSSSATSPVEDNSLYYTWRIYRYEYEL